MAAASNAVNNPRDGMVLVNEKRFKKLALLGVYVAHLYENELRTNYEATLGSGSGFGGWSGESYEEISKINEAKAFTKSLRGLYEELLDEDLPEVNESTIKTLEKSVDKLYDDYDWEGYGDGGGNDEVTSKE